MLVVWYIWSRFFWFITNELAPWPFVRYRLYRLFFANIFTYNQLNFFQKKILNWFYIYLFFLPMSWNFANNYFFTLNRNYFAPLGYKFISYEGLITHSGNHTDDLETLSSELFILKKSQLIQDVYFFETVVLLKYVSCKYYFSYFVYYMKSFYEFEPLTFKNNSNSVVFLSTLLAYTTNTFIKTISIYDLTKTLDFFNYVRSVSSLNFFSTTPQLPTVKMYEDFLVNFYAKLIKTKTNYITAYKRLNVAEFFFHDLTLTNLLVSKFNGKTYVNINSKWVSFLKKHLHIRFSESSVSKHVSLDTCVNQKIYYIRKNRIFNKGRYSRNRQLYRTGVFWCLWLNVIVVYGLYFFFYRFMFNFGYLWLGLAFLSFSFIFARVCQARLYDIRLLIKEVTSFWYWSCTLFSNFYSWFYTYYLSFFSNYIFLVYSNLVFNKVLPVFYTSYLYSFFLFFSEETRKIKSKRFVFYWEYFIGEDKSFLKIKTKIHWFKQVWKMLVT